MNNSIKTKSLVLFQVGNRGFEKDITQKIVSYLDPKSLLALRQVSKAGKQHENQRNNLFLDFGKKVNERLKRLKWLNAEDQKVDITNLDNKRKITVKVSTKKALNRFLQFVEKNKDLASRVVKLNARSLNSSEIEGIFDTELKTSLKELIIGDVNDELDLEGLSIERIKVGDVMGELYFEGSSVESIQVGEVWECGLVNMQNTSLLKTFKSDYVMGELYFEGSSIESIEVAKVWCFKKVNVKNTSLLKTFKSGDVAGELDFEGSSVQNFKIGKVLSFGKVNLKNTKSLKSFESGEVEGEVYLEGSAFKI